MLDSRSSTPDGTLRLTSIGEEGSLRSIADVVAIHLEESGDDQRDRRETGPIPTDRQRDQLELAVVLGYYPLHRFYGERRPTT